MSPARGGGRSSNAPRGESPRRGAGRTAVGGKGAAPRTGSQKGSGGSGRGPSSGPRSGGPRSGNPRGGGMRGGTPLRRDGESTNRALGGEQIEGRQAVLEALLAGTRKVREVVFAGDMDPAPILEDIIDLADELKVPLREIGRNKFEGMARTDAPQGVLAMAAPLREYDLDELMTTGAGDPPPFLLLVDGVTDPGNLGALLRSAECAGVTGVILPRHRAAHITATVTKSAQGAIERLRMATVPGLPTAMRTLKEAGIWSVGLDAAAEDSLFGMNLATEPIALVLGAEGSGLSSLVRQRCDMLVSVPMQGRLNSLNVSVAGALACFEVTRSRLVATP